MACEYHKSLLFTAPFTYCHYKELGGYPPQKQTLVSPALAESKLLGTHYCGHPYSVHSLPPTVTPRTHCRSHTRLTVHGHTPDSPSTSALGLTVSPDNHVAGDIRGLWVAADMSYVSLSEVKLHSIDSRTDSDDTVSTATSDIVLPPATRHAIEQGNKRGISLSMRSAKSTYKHGRRKDTTNAYGEKTTKIFPPHGDKHGHVLWMKSNIITSQALQRKG